MVINSNLFHNIANILSLLLAALTAVLLTSGCAATVTGGFDCSASWINPAYTSGAIALLQLIKIAVNIIRDGFAGLSKPQPPVT